MRSIVRRLATFAALGLAVAFAGVERLDQVEGRATSGEASLTYLSLHDAMAAWHEKLPSTPRGGW